VFAELHAASIWALQPMQTHAPSAIHGSRITHPSQSTIPGLPQWSHAIIIPQSTSHWHSSQSSISQVCHSCSANGEQDAARSMPAALGIIGDAEHVGAAVMA
jgi:hypothetical protein